MLTSACVIVLRGDTSVGPRTVDLFPCRPRDCPPIDIVLTLDLSPIDMIRVNPLLMVASLDLIIICGNGLPVW